MYLKESKQGLSPRSTINFRGGSQLIQGTRIHHASLFLGAFQDSLFSFNQIQVFL